MINSGKEVPSETIVNPIIASLTPNNPAIVDAPSINSRDPRVSKKIPPNNFTPAFNKLVESFSILISGSASWVF